MVDVVTLTKRLAAVGALATLSGKDVDDILRGMRPFGIRFSGTAVVFDGQSGATIDLSPTAHLCFS